MIVAVTIVHLTLMCLQMIFSDLTKQQSLLENKFGRRLFTRRDDLTNRIRLQIAIDALHGKLKGVWGTVTNLADEYGISRTFIYSLAETLKNAGSFLFDESSGLLNDLSPRLISIQMMLSLRMEGQCSIGGISDIMKRFDCELSSTGSISNIMASIGGLLPMTISTGSDNVKYLVFASDEIFSKSTPILVTADPKSSTILRIELADSRKADDWKNHFQCIFNNGVKAIYLVSDDGAGLRAGHDEAMSDVVRQSDTYHAIAHQLGRWLHLLEAKAYKAIALEQERKRVLDSSKSDPVQDKRLARWIRAVEVARKAIELYENFCYLYRCLIAELNVFDANGNLRTRQEAADGIDVCLALIIELNHTAISVAAEKSRRTLPDLLHYFDVAKAIIDECKELPISVECLKAYCIAWQWGKAIRKSKSMSRKNNAKYNEQFCIEIAEGLHEHENLDIKKEVYSRLDGIVQSSAMVECINSIIRPYLNTCKNHLGQELLNLIMFYHNHRRYRDGVRKGKSPMEILTGKEQSKDWISILFDIINEKDPEILAS